MTTMPTRQLDDTLRRTGRVKLLVDTLRESGRVLAVLLAAALGVVLIDAVVAFGPAGLIIIDILLLGLLGAAAGHLAFTYRRNAYDPRRIARLVEEGMGVTDSSLINAVDFADDAHATPSTGSDALRRLAVAEGDRVAATVNPTAVIDRRPLHTALKQAGVAMLVIALLYLAAPKLFNMVLPRYLSPTADLPPFTLLDFDVTVSPEKVYSGKPAEIGAKLDGPVVPAEASVVFIERDEQTGREVRRPVPMLRRADGGFTLPLQRVTESREFYIDTPEGRSHRHTLAVLPTPTFEKVTVRYDFPAYTGWPPVERPLDETGIRAIHGTRVTVTTQSNLPLDRSALVLRDGDFEQTNHGVPSQAEPRVVSNTWDLTRGGTFELSLTAADGAPSDRTITGPVVALDDAAPQVQIMSPDMRVIAPEGFKMPFAITAQDDVAVASAQLHSRVNDGASQGVDLTLDRRKPTYATASHTLDLAALGAKADDTVKVFATAFDNLPDTPQSADSATVEIAVVTKEKFDELARQQYGVEQIAQEIAALASAIAELDKRRDELIKELEALKQKMAEQGGKLDDEDRQRLNDIQRKLDELAKASKQLAESMRERASQEQLYEFEQAYKDTLNQLADRMDKQAAAAAAQSKALAGDPSQQDIDKTLADMKRDRDAAEQSQQATELTQKQLEQLRAADGMMAEAETIKAIARQQRDLAERLSTYREAESLTPSQQARAARLAEEQRELKEQLDASLKRLTEAATAARDTLPQMAESAIDLANHVRDIGVLDDQADAADRADDGKGGPAYASADAAATKLESLIKKCNGVCNNASDDLDGMFGLSDSQMQSMLNQLSQGRQGRGQKSGSRGASQGSGTGDGQTANRSGDGGLNANSPTLFGPTKHGLPTDPRMMVRKPHGSYSRAGDANTGDAPDGTGPQHLDPTTRDSRAAAPGNAFGVPAPYRDLAEQYFRRLAEDSR
ncbi:MAG: hypothetical protein GC159_10700 [Phycisphaera sp.]|nr:hypothetical protein [Phycisphaera sp.]